MYIDSNLTFCDSEDVSGPIGTEVIAAAIDLGAQVGKIGANSPMNLVILVQAAFASAGAATVQFRLVSDSTDPASSDGTETRHWQSAVFAYTALTAGIKSIIPLPGGIPAYERYLQLQVVTAAAVTTAGMINAFLTSDADNWSAYAEAVS